MANYAFTIADGLAYQVPDDQTLETIFKGVDRVEMVIDADIRRAMKIYSTDTHNIGERAATPALVVLLNDGSRRARQKVGLVQSGGNVDEGLFKSTLEEQ